MTVDQFQTRLSRVQVHSNDLKWMPCWLKEYASLQKARENELLVVDEASVLQFLRSLLKRGVPAWQRLQAVRAIEWYQRLILERKDLDFGNFKLKLGELAASEDRGGEIAGEEIDLHQGVAGLIDPNEPEAVRLLRTRMRVLKHPLSTETAYVSWIERFIRHFDDEHIEKFGEPEIGQFLTDLAVIGDVTASTQNQALSALLFYFRKVVGRDMLFIQRVRAKASQYLPVVLSQQEIATLLGRMRGVYQTMFQLMYGSGLRHRECRCLRIKDVCFDTMHIVVRNGKGHQDRITVLPNFVAESLKRCIDTAAAIIEMICRMDLGEFICHLH